MDRKIEKKFWTPRKILSIAGILVFTVFLGYLYISTSKGSRYQIDAERVTISTVTKDLFREFIPVTGTIIPIRTVFLDALEGGRVKEIFLEGGSFVEQGDVILELENTAVQQEVMQQEATFNEQRSNLENTRLQAEQNSITLWQSVIENDYQIVKSRRELQRLEALLNIRAVSQLGYEQAKDENDYYLSRKDVITERFRTDSLLNELRTKQLETSLDAIQR